MTDAPYEGIAIIGFAGRFPGAETVEELWSNLVAGKETISFFTDAELAESELDPVALRRLGQYVPARGVLKDADCFDAAFFGISNREAEVMDPQHRVFLEACWTALEHAGYAPQNTPSPVGVFAGAGFNTYYLNVLYRQPGLLELMATLAMQGNQPDYLATRVAYKLGLRGPAINVSTACSTSLVAVCQACQSLLTYQCDMALAGGVSVRIPQKSGYYYDEGSIGSADGHTRTFDVQASGTAFSNGVGVVVLKRLAEAVKEGDRVYAVIKGAALNNDGSQRVSFGAPGVEGQSEVIAMAQAVAGFDPETISYIEAHGTATPLGDPIEVAALTKAFRAGTSSKGFCALGSIKTNIGHLDAAAGVTGLIKTALALHHKQIPANLHFTQPNPKLDLENSPFYIPASLSPWTTKANAPRRAGVSSFGTGGTNAHVVLEEAPELPTSGSSHPWQLLVFSAKTPEALDRSTARLSEYLSQLHRHEKQGERSRELADTAYTLQTGRSDFAERRIVVCDDPAEAASALKERNPNRVFTGRQRPAESPIVFMFPGQGAQYPGMGAELYRSEPVFHAEIDKCAEFLEPIVHCDLRTLLFPAAGSEKEAEAMLIQTRFTQPAIFVIEYALAKLWISWGIRPAAMIGHSVGEYSAACVAGVITLEDALTLVAQRAALVQALPGGAMVAVRLPENEARSLLDSDLAIAAINSPQLCVVSGPYGPIAELEKKLLAQGVFYRRLHTSHAFHSPMMEAAVGPFREQVSKVKFADAVIPYVSNVTAQWITAADIRSPEYWASHVRETVRFADGIAQLMTDPHNVLLEVGPGQTLATLARQHPSKRPEQMVIASLPFGGAEEPRGILEAVGKLWITGAAIDWRSFYANERRCHVALPTYPFERKRHWPDSAAVDLRTSSVTSPLGTQTNTAAEFVAQRADASGPTVPVTATQMPPRRERLLAAARSLFQALWGEDLPSTSASFLELGLDSLLLTQASQQFQRKFGIPITFRQLMEDLGSLDEIASYLDAQLPPEAFSEASSAAIPKPSQGLATGSAGVSQNPLLEQILLQQQQLTNQILQVLGHTPAPFAAPTASPTGASLTETVIKPHGPFKPIDRSRGDISAQQRRELDELIARYTQRTAGSKRLAAENRQKLADPRSVAGFNRLWKEMVYPIATVRSDGSRVWDVDGNEYVDFVMGFGASLFGHRPPFVVDAVREQLQQGFEIGPIQPLAGEVAALISEFTGMARVAFTNTGSEAVLAATRLARTVTGRDKIAVFAGSYHGIFDEVLSRQVTINGASCAVPIAPGIPESAFSQVIVLDYGNPQSLDILRARGSEIAAVLVEPVQSRRLELQPKEFLHDLRQLTEDAGIALIFDEVVTGFRLNLGGAQAHFGVRADLATYGKVIGGGLPIGVVAGHPKFMDALDGGQWQYGDDSFPEMGVTFFAGTFVRHPLVLAAAKAVLTHLKKQGPGLQQRLNDQAARLAHQLRDAIDEFGVPYHVSQCTSLMHLRVPPEQKLAGLLFYLLRERGFHTYENRSLILTTAHTDDDLARLVTALRDSLSELKDRGLLPSSRVPLRSEAHPPHSSSGAPATDTVPLAASPRSDRGERFTLTEAQKEIWLAAQMNENAASAYNESLKLQFRGDFDVALFREAARQVLERHPILLAKFSSTGEWQQIPSDGTIDLPLVDLTELPEAEREERVAKIIEKEVSERFDLATGPLLRARIVRLATQHYVVIWTAHHIVCDGWSFGVVVNELAAIYSALKQGIQPSLQVPASFREYAVASQEQAVVRDSLAYWRQRFNEIPSPLDLPTDRPRPLLRSSRSSNRKLLLDPSLCQALKRVAGQQRTTLVVLLMAALKTLLHRLSGESDLIIGLGVAGQAMSGQKNLVGHCLNLLPIRTELRPETSFSKNLAVVKKSVLDAQDHYDATLGLILQHLNVPRTAGRLPLIEVIFNLDRDVSAAEFHGLNFSCTLNPRTSLHFDLFFNIVEGTDGLNLQCGFNTDLFEAATIGRWLSHYRTLLAAIAENPDEALDKLTVLTPPERQQLLVDWNRTTVAHADKGHCLHQLIENQVRRTPDQIAVVFESERLTYDDLNRRANRLAHHLRKLGIGPDSIVGVFLERSLEMVVALLGILKAGGAYLPLDPDYPKDRLAFMLEDAEAPMLLTTSILAAQLPAHRARMFFFDRHQSLLDSEPDTNPPHNTTPENLAYVIYTSGSTGKPKGVPNLHRGIVNRLAWMQGAYGLHETDRVLQKTPYSFDVSVWEFFWPLITGASLVLARPGGHKDPRYLVDTILERQITAMHFVPSMLRVFLEADGVQRCASLRRVFCSGEALPFGLQERFFEHLGAQLHNLYGPTEASVDVTSWQCRRGGRSIVPIGKPIWNTQTYILDRHLQPVPIGVAGELHIGGVGLARGYLKRPELTAEKFISDPFHEGTGALLYKTGDLARFLPDGNIEYLGRLDHQVKIRGFRIELGEIESVLQGHEQIQEVAVLAREQEPGDLRLVAYYALKPHGAAQPGAGPEELRSYLAAKLPEFMVPAAYVRLEAFPQTVSGKLDLKALPDPQRTAFAARAFEQPVGAVETRLAEIWSELLHVERVGRQDNFFELGGHSLLAVTMLARMGFKADISTLFAAPTLASLAAAIGGNGSGTKTSKNGHSNAEGHATDPSRIIHLKI